MHFFYLGKEYFVGLLYTTATSLVESNKLKENLCKHILYVLYIAIN